MLSLIFWTLTVIVSLKYVVLVLRADNNGEGGLIAMLALASQAVKDRPALRRVLLRSGIFGAALFYGDGVITPAISVLSAVEGLEVVAPALHRCVVPVTLVVLIALFAVQRPARPASASSSARSRWCGSRRYRAAGRAAHRRQPGTSCWRSTRSTRWASSSAHPGMAFIVLGAVVLCVTGAEALYADMGHFGKRPIRLAWFGW